MTVSHSEFDGIRLGLDSPAFRLSAPLFPSPLAG